MERMKLTHYRLAFVVGLTAVLSLRWIVSGFVVVPLPYHRRLLGVDGNTESGLCMAKGLFDLDDVLAQAKNALNAADKELGTSPKPPPVPPPPPTITEKIKSAISDKVQEAADYVVSEAKAVPGRAADAAARKAEEVADYIVSEARAVPGKLADAAASAAKEAGEYIVEEAKAAPAKLADAAARTAKETGDYIVQEAKATPGRVADAATAATKEAQASIERKFNELTGFD